MFQLATKLKPSREGLEAAEQAGLSAVEFWTDASTLEGQAQLAALVGDFEFQVVVHFPNRGQLSHEHLSNAVQLYEALSCEAMVIHQPMFAKYGEDLLALSPSLRLGVENHRLSVEQFGLWAESNRWLTLDVEHLWKFTLGDCPLSELDAALKEFLAKFGHKLAHVHLPGYLPGCEEHRPMYCSRDMIMVVLSSLADAGFEGLVVSEVNAQFQNVHDMGMDVLLVDRWRQLRASAREAGCPDISSGSRETSDGHSQPRNSHEFRYTL